MPVVASSAGPAPASGRAGSHSSPPAPRLPAALLGLERSHPDASQAGSAYHSSGPRVAHAAPHLHWGGRGRGSVFLTIHLSPAAGKGLAQPINRCRFLYLVLGWLETQTSPVLS